MTLGHRPPADRRMSEMADTLSRRSASHNSCIAFVSPRLGEAECLEQFIEALRGGAGFGAVTSHEIAAAFYPMWPGCNVDETDRGTDFDRCRRDLGPTNQSGGSVSHSERRSPPPPQPSARSACASFGGGCRIQEPPCSATLGDSSFAVLEPSLQPRERGGSEIGEGSFRLPG
jgi:hypothetical protein